MSSRQDSRSTHRQGGKEEINAVNTAKKKKEPPTMDDSKGLIKYQDWSQTETDVIINLFAGRKLTSPNELDVEYTKNSVTVRLTGDGRMFTCKFYKDIDLTSSKVQLSKMKIKLKVKKKEPCLWPALEHSPHEEVAPQQTSVPKSSGGQGKGKSSRRAHVPQQSTITTRSSATTMSQVEQESKPPQEKKGSQHKTAKSNGHERSPPCSAYGVNKENKTEKPPVSTADTDKAQNITDIADEEIIPDNSTKTKDVHVLDMVKHDWYEPNTEKLVAHLYVKEINKDSLTVEYGAKHLAVYFRTTDAVFLATHKNLSSDAVFCWKVDLVDKLIKENCKHKLSKSCVELQLIKQNPRKWGALEASLAKDHLPRPSTSNWMPTSSLSKPTASSVTQDAKRGGDKAVKPIFDDFTDSKPKAQPTEDKEKSSTSTPTSKVNILGDSNRDMLQKPTCKVPPLNKNHLETGMVVRPGMSGLDNLGNTCFMNCVLQILANSRELRDYFLEGRFQKEINTDNPLGTGGKLAISFAVLLKVLWAGTHHSYAPAKLKNLIGLKASQFMGYAQHDTSEFLGFLLDGLHEDINRVKEKPYTGAVESDDRPDELVADEAWAVHKKRNDSFIVDMFQGQYKSKLVCPKCGKVSITFDPFMMLPVPLPKKQRLLGVIFISKDPYKKPVKYMLRLAKDATVENLKDGLHQLTSVHPRDLRVFEVYKNKILTFFGKGSSLANVSNTDKIVACEVLSEKVAGESVVEIPVVQRTVHPNVSPTRCSHCKRECPPNSKLKRCMRCLRNAYCDHACQKQHWQQHRPYCRFTHDLVGQPFYISLPESQATHSRICKMAEVYSRYSLDVFQPPLSSIDPEIVRDEFTTSAAIPTSPSTNGIAASFSSQSLEGATCAATPADSGVNLDADLRGSQTSVNSAGTSDTSTSQSTITSGSSIDSDTTLSEQDTGIDTMSDRTSFDEADKGRGHPEMGGDDDAPPTGYVIARQDAGDTIPTFALRPVDREGVNLPGPGGHKLDDKGEQPLDLTSVHYLAMDWKNSEKCNPYVLIQTKELECEDHETVQSLQTEDGKDIALDQCLSLFTEPEVLSPEHAWYCPSCKEHREATKQMSIWRLPHTLIITLKRFSFRNFLWRDKIDKMVEFPIRGLDLSKYYIGSRPTNEPPPIYDLYGVVNHHGGILGGHYTSYARCPDTVDWKCNEVDWRLFDDSIVTPKFEQYVMNRNAYVLFYRRRNVVVPLPATLSSPVSEESDESVDPFESRECNSGSDLEEPIITTMTDDKLIQGAPPSGYDTVDNAEGSATLTETEVTSGTFTDMDAVD